MCRQQQQIEAWEERFCQFHTIWERQRGAVGSFHREAIVPAVQWLSGPYGHPTTGLVGGLSGLGRVPILASPVTGWARAPPYSPKWARASLLWWGAVCPAKVAKPCATWSSPCAPYKALEKAEDYKEWKLEWSIVKKSYGCCWQGMPNLDRCSRLLRPKEHLVQPCHGN